MSSADTGVKVFRERVFPILFMALLTAISIAMVSGIYLATRDLVSRNESLYLKRAVLFAAGLAVPEGPAEVEQAYTDAVRERTDENGDPRFYEVVGAGGNVEGYVIPRTGPGLWGEIEAVVGLERDLRVLTGVDFTKQNETPGLGARISEDWFRAQFRGKTGPFSLVPEGTPGEGDQEFDAITGATITSTAVMNILNSALEEAADTVE